MKIAPSTPTLSIAATISCPCRKLNPDVSVVQSAQNCHRQYATEWLDSARSRRVLVQGQVRSGAIVIIGISSKQMTKMPLAKHQDMVKAFASDRTDQPLTIAVLPWRPWRGRTIPNAHRPKAPGEDFAVYAIPIAHQIAWPLLPAVGLRQLATYPFRAGMCSH
jgi:hypothetical protein